MCQGATLSKSPVKICNLRNKEDIKAGKSKMNSRASLELAKKRW